MKTAISDLVHKISSRILKNKPVGQLIWKLDSYAVDGPRRNPPTGHPRTVHPEHEGLDAYTITSTIAERTREGKPTKKLRESLAAIAEAADYEKMVIY